MSSELELIAAVAIEVRLLCVPHGEDDGFRFMPVHTSQYIPGSMERSSCSALILAAGASTRFGEPKQAVLWNGLSLLRRAALTALECESDDVIVVLGAHSERVRTELEGLPVFVADNPLWKEGIAGSLRVGVQAAIDSRAQSILVTLADQPLVTPSHLNNLIAAWRNGAASVATSYAGTFGAPALFDQTRYPDLLALRGDCGAKAVLARHASALACVPFAEAATDIDRRADLAALCEREPNSAHSS